MSGKQKNNIARLMADAIASHQGGDLRSASKGYERVLKRERNHVEAIQLLGLIAYQNQDYERAGTLLTRAIALKPDHGVATHNLARLRESEGQLDLAAQLYRKAISLMPGNADTTYSLANVLIALGEFTEAESWHRRTLALDPGYAPAYRQLARLLPHTTVDADMLAMKNSLNDPTTPATARVHLAFGLGKAYEDLQDYERAFEYFTIGNDAQRALLRFDINELDFHVEHTIRAFPKSLFDGFQSHGRENARPIFILGMPRSGTTLVEQILASHSEVYGAGELQALNHAIMSHLDARAFPGNAATLSHETLQAMADHYLAETRLLSSNAAYVTDKKPDNFRLIGMINLIFPNAIVIHCRRDPLDNCLSLYKNHFADTGPFYSYDQIEVARYYKGYSRLIAHWHDVLPGFIHDVQYESVVADVESETHRLLDLCGLPFEPACLEFHRFKRGVQTASAVQVRKPIYRDSVGAAARHYQSYLGPMIKELADIRGS